MMDDAELAKWIQKGEIRTGWSDQEKFMHQLLMKEVSIDSQLAKQAIYKGLQDGDVKILKPDEQPKEGKYMAIFRDTAGNRYGYKKKFWARGGTALIGTARKMLQVPPLTTMRMPPAGVRTGGPSPAISSEHSEIVESFPTAE
jgi:hypothetical protein